jgi:hypothetical protein
MTKVIILGQEPEQKKLKPIEFVKIIHEEDLEIITALCIPKDWKNIELIGRGKGYDIMYAYDHHRNIGRVFLGHFNDGVVE